MLLATGFAHALGICLALQEHGFSWCPPPCGSWIWLSRSVTKRNHRNIGGDLSNPWVRKSNKIVDRMCLLLIVLSWRKVWWVVEQPLSSTLFRYKSFLCLLQMCKDEFHLDVIRQFIWMGAFGHCLLKPSVLMGSWPELITVKSTCRPGSTGRTFERSVQQHEKHELHRGQWKLTRNVNGKKGILKKSAAYPKNFCEYIAGKVRRCSARSDPCDRIRIARRIGAK